MRKANALYIFLAGMVIAVFVSIPLVNLATRSSPWPSWCTCTSA